MGGVSTAPPTFDPLFSGVEGEVGFPPPLFVNPVFGSSGMEGGGVSTPPSPPFHPLYPAELGRGVLPPPPPHFLKSNIWIMWTRRVGCVHPQCVYAYTYIYVSIYIYMCTYMCIHVYIYLLFMYINTHTYIFIIITIYICIYIHIEIMDTDVFPPPCYFQIQCSVHAEWEGGVFWIPLPLLFDCFKFSK